MCVRKIKSISGFALAFFLTLRHACPLRPMRSAVCFFSPDAHRGGQRLIKAFFSPRFTCNPLSTHCHGNRSGNCAEVTHVGLDRLKHNTCAPPNIYF